MNTSPTSLKPYLSLPHLNTLPLHTNTQFMNEPSQPSYYFWSGTDLSREEIIRNSSSRIPVPEMATNYIHSLVQGAWKDSGGIVALKCDPAEGSS